MTDDKVRVALYAHDVADQPDVTPSTTEYAYSADDVAWDIGMVTEIKWAKIYSEGGDARYGYMEWLPWNGWTFYPPKYKPRPWKVHTPGRFRQRRRR